MKLNQMIDHTILNPDATYDDVMRIVKEAKEYHFKTVCVQPFWIKKVREALGDAPVGITTVIGFPLGANATDVKVYETRKAIEDGADEIDMVLNIGALKSGMDEIVQADIEAVVQAAEGKVVKVIIETCLLTKDEIKKVSKMVIDAGADFVKTSTGFSTGGAKVEDIKLIKETIGDTGEIKASGGIRTTEDAKAMIEAGATRIGASKSIEIVKGEL